MPIGVSAGIGAALTGVSAISGLFGKKQQQTTNTTTTPTFTADQTGLQSDLAAKLKDRLTNPASLDPLKTAAASKVNRNYDTLQGSLDRTLAARGFGNSGKAVTGTKDLAIRRAGDLGSLQSQFAALKIDQDNEAIRQAQQFGFASPGSKSTGVTTSSSGGGAAGAVGGGAETASLLYSLNHFLNGGAIPHDDYNPNFGGSDAAGAAASAPPLSLYGGGLG